MSTATLRRPAHQGTDSDAARTAASATRRSTSSCADLILTALLAHPMPPHDLIARLHQGRHDVSQSALYRAIQVLHLRGFIEPVLNRTPSQAVTALADRTPIPWNGSDAEVAAWRSAKGLPGPEATVWSLTDRGRDMAVMVKKAKMTKVLPDRSHVGAWLLSICS